jgi:tRNA-specific 2-thiouridylase
VTNALPDPIPGLPRAAGDVTVAVGLSGGVDSSIAAWLLQRHGYRVIGLTMQIWDGALALPDEGRSGCYGPGEARDIAAAQALARRLGIPHHVVPLAPEYAVEVLDYFRAEYLAGRTPNPCVRCNRTMKFGLMLERARAMGIVFDRFATGHYARVEHDPATGREWLRKSVDAAKDQTYFLSRLTQAQLAQVMFPLGGLAKPQVKGLAREIGWAEIADKDESQNFIESKDYGVLFQETGQTPGPIVDAGGRVVGQHRGVVHYTVGQRKGLGIGGAGEPLYVIRIDACANTVVVGTHADCFAGGLTAGDLNWIAAEPALKEPRRIRARIRQQHREAGALLTVRQEGGRVLARVAFDEPQMAVTPGQAVVFYEDDLVLGSGIIEAAFEGVAATVASRL